MKYVDNASKDPWTRDKKVPMEMDSCEDLDYWDEARDDKRVRRMRCNRGGQQGGWN
jgi:hypothetical protein